MSNETEVEVKEYQGAQIASVPRGRGLYAWYYRPRVGVQKDALIHTLAQFLNPSQQVVTSVGSRYGIQMTAKAVAEVSIGAERQSVEDVLNDVYQEAEPFLSWFFHSRQFAHFCRPIYIGIAKNIHNRVYSQHYETLIEYWDPDSRLSKFTSNNKTASVGETMKALDIPHSFALEARVLGIRAHDLMVSVLATDKIPDQIGLDESPDAESGTRRALERLLQLLADPICGRR